MPVRNALLALSLINVAACATLDRVSPESRTSSRDRVTSASADATATALTAQSGRDTVNPCIDEYYLELELDSPPPESMAELLDSVNRYDPVDLIVVGVIGDELSTAVIVPGDPTVLYPMTRYAVLVEKVLHGDDSLSAGDTFVLRHWGTDEYDHSPCDPTPRQGTRNLFFLGHDDFMDPGEYEVINGTHGRIDIDAGPFRFTDEDRTVVSFARGLTPSEFLDAVTEAAADR